jgi:hypothetical protein
MQKNKYQRLRNISCATVTAITDTNKSKDDFMNAEMWFESEDRCFLAENDFLRENSVESVLDK